MKSLATLITTLLSVFLFTASFSAQEKPKAPSGWGTTGDNPAAYDFLLDTSTKHSGTTSVLIRSKATAVEKKFGSLIQAIRPDDYRGKRIRFSGYMKTENVGESAQLWVRVDGPGMRMLDFSNMEASPIKGTTDWKKYDLVVDVPTNAEAIVFGALLVGPSGQAWFDDLKLETVASDTAKTSNVVSDADRREEEEFLNKTPKAEIDKIIASYRALPTKPVNLDFEQVAVTNNVAPKTP